MTLERVSLPPLEQFEARPHVVCSINAVVCILAIALGIVLAGSRDRWGWEIGGLAAGLANFIMFGVLMVLFPKRATHAGVSLAVLLCVVWLLFGFWTIAAASIQG
jgi:hypothetical protein